MRNLEGSGWMSSPELSIIEAKAQETGGAVIDIKSLPYVFTLKVKLPAPGENQAQQPADAAAVVEPAAAAPATPEAPKAAVEPAAAAPKEARS
jgi:type IV pilus assembly protein PilN